MESRQRRGLLVIIPVVVAVAGSASLKTADKEIAADDKLCGCLEIVSRARWGARPPKPRTPLAKPVSLVIIAHTVGDFCSTLDDCSREVRNVQDFHMDYRGWDDIGYNFLVGDDGNVYEGRGWDAVGAHTRGFNTRALGIAFMGNFDKVPPSPRALKAAQRLLRCGQARGTLAPDYRLYGHRQATPTQSPGDLLFAVIQGWSHFSAGAAY